MFENAHLAHSHADTEDGVGSQLVLVVGAVQAQLKETKLVSLSRPIWGKIYHELVDLLLLDGVHALGDDLRGDHVVDVVHSLRHDQECDGIAMGELLQEPSGLPCHAKCRPCPSAQEPRKCRSRLQMELQP